MRSGFNIAGTAMVVIGAIWFLQGVNILPGSFMTGHIEWAVYGGFAMFAGIGLLLAAKRSRKS